MPRHFKIPEQDIIKAFIAAVRGHLQILEIKRDNLKKRKYTSEAAMLSDYVITPIKNSIEELERKIASSTVNDVYSRAQNFLQLIKHPKSVLDTHRNLLSRFADFLRSLLPGYREDSIMSFRTKTGKNLMNLQVCLLNELEKLDQRNEMKPKGINQ